MPTKRISRKSIEEGLKTMPMSGILGSEVSRELTAKQRKFAREIALGATKADAYRAAYDVTSKYTMASKPYELIRDERIRREVEAYQAAIEAERYRTPAALRSLVIQTLTQTIIDPDTKPAVRLNAAKILGNITEVAAFTERKEIRTISSSDDARAKIMGELRGLLKAGAEDISTDADALLRELAGETHPGGTPLVVVQESQADIHTIPHKQPPISDQQSPAKDPPPSNQEDPPVGP